jgi:hypothetical protein
LKGLIEANKEKQESDKYFDANEEGLVKTTKVSILNNKLNIIF